MSKIYRPAYKLRLYRASSLVRVESNYNSKLFILLFAMRDAKPLRNTKIEKKLVAISTLVSDKISL